VTDEAQVEATVAAAVAAHGRLDVMLSNAGVLLPTGPVTDMDLSALDRVMAVNFRGADRSGARGRLGARSPRRARQTHVYPSGVPRR
jgi:NAD(P)-dependent dehydrogenase (short-subunit alcohol dehydrogenase family)